MNKLIPAEIIENKIFIIRGEKVMLDRDLAKLYRVKTSQLKRQVKRNWERFPDDFMFILNQEEIKDLVCHFGIPSKSVFGGALPWAFTEYGILMLSSVLNSTRAIQVNIQIMRTFTRLRKLLASNKAVWQKIQAMENKYDKRLKAIFNTLKILIKPPMKAKQPIGFLRERKTNV
jgi:hypothetical protein